MLHISRLSLSAFPDSPYAAELERGVAKLRFAPELEAEYVRAHLMDNRTLVRVASTFSVVLTLSRMAEHQLSGNWQPAPMVVLGFIFLSTALLAWLSWTPSYERRYLPWARTLIPVRNAIAAAQVAIAAAGGQPEILIVLPPLIMGPFFFVGFRYRTGMLTGITTTTSFLLATLFVDLPMPVLLRVLSLVVVSLIACSIAARHMERLSRTSFLETGLIMELAQHDGLTGMKNRRVLDEHLVHLWPRASRDSRPLAVLLIDVDHFKAYNDRYGHQAGDQVLRQVAQSLESLVRSPFDILARYGGEEFAAVLYGITETQARNVAERMRRAVQDLGIEHRGARDHDHVTISIGVAVIAPTTHRTPRGAVQLADQALYLAKTQGRNRVEVMTDTEYQMLVTGVFVSQPPANQASQAS